MAEAGVDNGAAQRNASAALPHAPPSSPPVRGALSRARAVEFNPGIYARGPRVYVRVDVVSSVGGVVVRLDGVTQYVERSPDGTWCDVTTNAPLIVPTRATIFRVRVNDVLVGEYERWSRLAMPLLRELAPDGADVDDGFYYVHDEDVVMFGRLARVDPLSGVDDNAQQRTLQVRAPPRRPCGVARGRPAPPRVQLLDAGVVRLEAELAPGEEILVHEACALAVARGYVVRTRRPVAAKFGRIVRRVPLGPLEPLERPERQQPLYRGVPGAFQLHVPQSNTWCEAAADTETPVHARTAYVFTDDPISMHTLSAAAASDVWTLKMVQFVRHRRHTDARITWSGSDIDVYRGHVPRLGGYITAASKDLTGVAFLPADA